MEVNQTLTNQVCAVLADALRVAPDEISTETQFGDLPQWDSMGHMEVMVALEKEYGVEINAETITELVSIPLIVAHIEGRQNG